MPLDGWSTELLLKPGHYEYRLVVDALGDSFNSSCFAASRHLVKLGFLLAGGFPPHSRAAEMGVKPDPA
jgi:hypothetical protein